MKRDWFWPKTNPCAHSMPGIRLYDPHAQHYVQNDWVYLDEGPCVTGFGVFRYFIRSDTGAPFRLEMPGGDGSIQNMHLDIDLRDFRNGTSEVPSSVFDLPPFCNTTAAAATPSRASMRRRLAHRERAHSTIRALSLAFP